MRISSITPTSVWGASSRSLTNIGSGALAITQAVFTSIAASGSVDLRSSAGVAAQMTIGGQTGGTATQSLVVQIWDGANSFQIAQSTAGANAFVGFSGTSTNSIGLRVVNLDGAVAAHYMTSAFSWTI